MEDEGSDLRREALRRLGVPRLYQDARLEDFAPRDLKRGQWIFDEKKRAAPRDVLIVGDNGTGKTSLAAGLAYSWKAKWCSVLALLRRVRRCFKSNVEESEFSIVEDLTAPRVLVLDDITAAAMTDFGLSTVLGILSARIEDMKPTVVTCYHDLAAIDRLDSSLASRLAAFERIEVVGGDRRVR